MSYGNRMINPLSHSRNAARLLTRCVRCSGLGAGRGGTGPVITSNSKLLRCMRNTLVKGPKAVPFSANSQCLSKSESRLDRRLLGLATYARSYTADEYQRHQNREAETGGAVAASWRPRRCSTRPRTPDGHAVDAQLEVMGKRTTLLPRAVATGSAVSEPPGNQEGYENGQNEIAADGLHGSDFCGRPGVCPNQHANRRHWRGWCAERSNHPRSHARWHDDTC